MWRPRRNASSMAALGGKQLWSNNPVARAIQSTRGQLLYPQQFAATKVSPSHRSSRGNVGDRGLTEERRVRYLNPVHEGTTQLPHNLYTIFASDLCKAALPDSFLQGPQDNTSDETINARGPHECGKVATIALDIKR